jgi:hypothetical protein
MARWSIPQVLALAPDERAVRTAKALARPRPWSDLGSTDALVWGKCQGSGKEPYQVTVDLAEPAFRCTCPSRKLPCKHGLGLLLLWAANDGSVGSDVSAAPFAAAWADERAVRAERRAARASAAGRPEEAGGGDGGDPEARARRAEARRAAMTAGLEDLDRWLGDLVRQGLATARTQPYGFWDGQAARLVDQQLPGLAERVRALGSAVLGRADWAPHLVAELGRLHLAAAAWAGRDELPAALAGDLRAYLGWPVPTDEVRATPPQRGAWQVLGVRQGGDERLRNQRTWLRDLHGGDTVLLLDFAVAGGSFGVAHVVGTVVHGGVHRHPGAAPARALLADGGRVSDEPLGTLPGADTIDEALAQVAATVAANPWCDRVALTLEAVTPARAETGELVAIDASGRWLPLHDDRPWQLLALTGGRPVGLFGEWEDDTLVAVSVAVDGRLIPR